MMTLASNVTGRLLRSSLSEHLQIRYNRAECAENAVTSDEHFVVTNLGASRHWLTMRSCWSKSLLHVRLLVEIRSPQKMFRERHRQAGMGFGWPWARPRRWIRIWTTGNQEIHLQLRPEYPRILPRIRVATMS
jgi:hypothetical protein